MTARVTLRIVVDAASRKRTLVVSYESDADALPMEHEDAHRALVDRLVEGGIARVGDRVIVERAGDAHVAVAEGAGEGAATREGSKEGA